MKNHTAKNNTKTVNGTTYQFNGTSLFEFKPCVKLWIAFKHEHFKPTHHNAKPDGQKAFKTSKTFYMPEMQNSMAQVLFRGHEPIINWQLATDRAIHLVNDVYHGKFKRAIIAFETRHLEKNKDCIMFQFNEHGKLLANSSPFNFDSESWQTFKKSYTRELAFALENSDMVIDYQNDKQVHFRCDYTITEQMF